MLINNITIEQLLDAAPVPETEVKIFRYPNKVTECQWRWFGKNNQIYGFSHGARNVDPAEIFLDYCKKKMAEVHESSNHRPN